MVVFSFEHFLDGYAFGNHKSTAKKISKNMATALRHQSPAIFYINGASYYFKPLHDNIWGFGSGELELEIAGDTKEDSLLDTFIKFFDKCYTEEVAYGGYERSSEAKDDINRRCDW